MTEMKKHADGATQISPGVRRRIPGKMCVDVHIVHYWVVVIDGTRTVEDTPIPVAVDS